MVLDGADKGEVACLTSHSLALGAGALRDDPADSIAERARFCGAGRGDIRRDGAVALMIQ